VLIKNDNPATLDANASERVRKYVTVKLETIINSLYVTVLKRERLLSSIKDINLVIRY
jgi:hypothetical protein